MKFNFMLLTLLVAALFATTACNKSTNPLMQAPPEVVTTVDRAAPQLAIAKDPKVNILFVVDNSQSMDAHQAKLKANIDKFADKFFDNPRIDYKIGVVPVYDREFLNDRKNYNYHEYVNGRKVMRYGPRKMNEYGVLVPLKDKNGQVIEGAPYITRETPDAKNVLKNTVAIGTQWGPEAEESFSPVVEIITNEKLNQEVNAGFYDKDAYLVVIFLTDADDVTPGLTPDSFYNDYLLPAKNNDARKILIAAALPSAKSHSAACALDGNGPQYKFPALMDMTSGLVADLCSNSFGQKLAELGDQLVSQVGSQRIKIGHSVDADSIVVTYGTKDMPLEDRQVIPRSKEGYAFNPTTTEIVLSSKLNITRVPDGEVFISAIPVNLSNAQNGRLKTTAE